VTTTASQPTEGTVDREVGCPVFHQDFSEEQPLGCHWALADRLREQGPLYFNTYAQGYWIFTRHDAVKEIYKNPDIFSSESITPWQPEPIYRFVPTQIDPPKHIKYRRILNPWFSPRRMDEAEPMVRSICRRLVEQTAPQGGCNFVKEFALRYPTEVFLAVIGIDLSHADRFLVWVEDFFRGFGGDPEGQAAMADALQGIRQYWVDAIAERRRDPAPREGDIASYLLNAEFDGERPLTDDELLDILTVLVLAGLDTTRSQLGYMFRHLAMHPEDRRRLIDEPELVPSAVEEVLRFYSPVTMAREVVADVEFAGCPMHVGDKVLLTFPAGNRDPAVFDAPDEFQIDRAHNRHFAFGAGIHRCLGSNLARMELRVALETFLARIPTFTIDDADDPHWSGGQVRGPRHVALRW
jgi:cytochrome P450